MRKMRKYLTIFEEAVRLPTRSLLEILIYEENLIFFFFSEL
jgi:hypothetical protein